MDQYKGQRMLFDSDFAFWGAVYALTSLKRQGFKIVPEPKEKIVYVSIEPPNRSDG